jgi:hypothetical protein
MVEKYSQKHQGEELKGFLLEQIKVKRESKIKEKNKEKEIVTRALIKEKEIFQKEANEDLEQKLNKKEEFLRGNEEVIEIKQRNKEIDKQKKLFEIEKEKKMRDIYMRELKEVKEKNDKYKKFMYNILTKQIDERKKKDGDLINKKPEGISVNRNYSQLNIKKK